MLIQSDFILNTHTHTCKAYEESPTSPWAMRFSLSTVWSIGSWFVIMPSWCQVSELKKIKISSLCSLDHLTQVCCQTLLSCVCGGAIWKSVQWLVILIATFPSRVSGFFKTPISSSEQSWEMVTGSQDIRWGLCRRKDLNPSLPDLYLSTESWRTDCSLNLGDVGWWKYQRTHRTRS